MKYPSELDFLEKLGVSPLASMPSDGFWCYEIADDSGHSVQLSFNAHEQSIQTQLRYGDREICTVVCEGAERLIIENDQLVRADFATSATNTSLTLKLGSEISCEWSTLASE